MLRAATTILRKDLLLELRTKEAVPAMTLFTLTVYVLFHFGLDRNSLDGERSIDADLARVVARDWEKARLVPSSLRADVAIRGVDPPRHSSSTGSHWRLAADRKHASITALTT